MIAAARKDEQRKALRQQKGALRQQALQLQRVAQAQQEKALRQQKEDTRALMQAMYFLLQTLSGCFALGGYFAVAPTGGFLCKAAYTGLAVFYKPLSIPLWFCLLVLLDTSGVKLKHNLLTESLTWVVQSLFAAWFLACGLLSLPLLVVFPMYGLMFVTPALVFKWLKYEELRIVQQRAIASGPPDFAGTKDEWDELTEAERTSYLATEQVYDRIIGYSFFAANVFGISLWDFYATGDWVGTLSKTGSALGVSMPVWDLPTLALSLRWPSELPLPQQLPLFVSASVAGLELLQRLWRWGAKRFGLSTADEIRARARKYRVLPQHGELGPPVRMDERPGDVHSGGGAGLRFQV